MGPYVILVDGTGRELQDRIGIDSHACLSTLGSKIRALWKDDRLNNWVARRLVVRVILVLLATVCDCLFVSDQWGLGRRLSE